MKHIETQIKDLLKEFLPEEFGVWGDTFDIEQDGERVLVLYHGDASIGAFKKACKKTLISCIDSVLGVGKKIKFVKKKGLNALSPKARKNLRAVKFLFFGLVFISIAASAIILLMSYVENRGFTETFYSTSSIKVDSRVRVIQLSDMHSVTYGEKLTERIKALAPDIILCTGDMVNSTETDRDGMVSLGKTLAEIAPTYYIYGNNEVASAYGLPLTEEALDQKFGFTDGERDETAILAVSDPFELALEDVGVKVLKNQMDTVRVKTMDIDVYGVLNSNPSSFWSYSENAFLSYLNENKNHLKITAVHEPFLFEVFSPETWGDLLVCGHTHGGAVRVPILGPLYTSEGGILPERDGKFVYGRYDVAGTPLIVSSGLFNGTLFRVNNPPELVIIDINKF